MQSFTSHTSFIKTTLFFAMALLSFPSCKEKEAPATNTPAPGTPAAQTTSDISTLEWTGTYYGQLPCEDCTAIETFLTLDRHAGYTYSTRRLGTDEQLLIRKGKFTITPDGKTLVLEGVLDGPSEYRVGQNVVVPKEYNGKQVTDAMAMQYRLLRTVESILGQARWNLTELLGKNFESSAAHVRFDVDAMQVVGFGWCNTFNGSYTLEGENKVRFGEMIPTLRTCPDTTVEKQFLNAFHAVDRFELTSRTLSLNRGGLPAMMKFEASEGR